MNQPLVPAISSSAAERRRVVLVWCVFALACAAALFFALKAGTRTPFTDDLTQVSFLLPDKAWTWESLWKAHNEHRIPIGRWLYWFSLDTTRDYRWVCALTVLLMSGLVAALMLSARRLRGSTSLCDVFFPIAWLSISHAENFLNAFQLTLVPSFGSSVGAALLVVNSRGNISLPRAAAIGLCFVCGSLGGPIGWMPIAPLMLWVSWRLWLQFRADLAPWNRAWLGFAPLAMLAGALVLWQLLTHTPLDGSQNAPLARAWVVAAQFIATGLGPLALDSAPYNSVAVWLLLGGSAWLVLRGARESLTAQALLLWSLGQVLLALAIGIGRGLDDPHAGYLDRYAHFSLPLASALYLGLATRAKSSRWAAGMCWAFVALWCLALPLGIRYGMSTAKVRSIQERGLLHSLGKGLPLQEAAARHWRDFYYGAEHFRLELNHLLELEMGPFEDAQLRTLQHAQEGRPAPMMRAPILRVDSPEAVLADKAGQLAVLIVRPHGELALRQKPGYTTLRGRFGLLESAWVSGGSDGVLFAIEVRDRRGHRTRLYERWLDPRTQPADRGPQSFEVLIPAGLGTRVLCITTNPEGSSTEGDWSYWTELEWVPGR